MAEESNERAKSSGTETILLVEDEQLLRDLTAQILRRHGYNVLVASSAVQALEICFAYSGVIHLVLTDVVLPHLSGRQLADRLDSSRPETKVLFMSGHLDDLVVRHGIFQAEVNFIAKPFLPDVLAQKVREVLA